MDGWTSAMKSPPTRILWLLCNHTAQRTTIRNLIVQATNPRIFSGYAMHNPVVERCSVRTGTIQGAP
eukprot:m.169844 g.169844  ORF g.169844 m.169844 type:complete len:67 (-) comp14511_c0_seq2:681-881(-)